MKKTILPVTGSTTKILKLRIELGKHTFQNDSSEGKWTEELYRKTEVVFARLLNWFRNKFHKNKDGRKSHISEQEQSAKCPYCGNVVELVLGRMSYQDPCVEKCDHCRCTITYPGTRYITESGDYIPTWSRLEPYINLENGEVKLSGRVQDSVGQNYEVHVYPEDSFSVKRNVTYLHPEMMNNGTKDGDEAIVEYSLKPLNTGLSCIHEHSYVQGNLKEDLIHYIFVE